MWSKFEIYMPTWCPSQWPRCIRLGSAAASFPGVAGSNPDVGMDTGLLWTLCWQVEVSSSGQSLVQRSPSECGMSECERVASTLRRPTKVCRAIVKKRNMSFARTWTMILSNDPLDAHFFFVYVYLNSLHVSSIQVLIIRRFNCITTIFGICHCM